MREGNYQILLVEDDDAHAEVVRRCLEETGRPISLMRISDGQSALDYFYRQGEYGDRERYPRPELIILDLRLPKVDGLILLNVIKSDPDLLHIPTVILSTSEAEADRAQAYSSHANSYLVKPLDLARFSAMIGAIGEYWMSWNEPSPYH